MVKLKVPQLSPQEAHQFALLTWGQIYAASVRALVDRLGSAEALETLRPRLREVGGTAPAFAEMMGITGKDAIAIGSLIHLIEEQVLLVEGKPVEVSPDRVVKQISKCPFQGFAPEFCQALLIANEGMVEAINPQYKMTMPMLIPNGDPVCEWILEKK